MCMILKFNSNNNKLKLYNFFRSQKTFKKVTDLTKTFKKKWGFNQKDPPRRASPQTFEFVGGEAETVTTRKRPAFRPGGISHSFCLIKKMYLCLK